jgi:hypothetical protein
MGNPKKPLTENPSGESMKTGNMQRTDRLSQISRALVILLLMIGLSSCSGLKVESEGNGYRVLSQSVSSGAREGKCSNCGNYVSGSRRSCPYCGAGFLNSYREGEVVVKVEINTQDPHQLFDMAMNGQIPWTCMAAVVSISDETVLQKIALEAPRNDTREYAATLIKDELFLQKIVLNDPKFQVQEAALLMISDEDFLKQYVLDETISPFSRAAAIHNIHDELFLKEIAKPGGVKYKVPEDIPVLRQTALAGISDQHFLSEMAIHDTDTSMRSHAVSKIQDPKILQQIVEKETVDGIRKKAYKRLKILETDKIVNQDALKEIATSWTNTYDKASAIARIEDQKFLIDLFHKFSRNEFARDVLASIKDQRFLKKVASKSETYSVDLRVVAIKRIDDKEFLKQCIIDDSNQQIRDVALATIGNIIHGKFEKNP